MKFLTSVLLAHLVASHPHGPEGATGKSIALPSPSSVAGSTAPKALTDTPAPAPAPAPATQKQTITPAGCRQIITDATYPSAEIWKAELPKAELRNVELEGEGHTEYKIAVQNYQDVIDSVKFAAKHNLRLAVINSGHDFLGRNDAPTGLAIDVSGLMGIKVLEEFVPTAKGAEIPTMKANLITPQAGKSPAVTIGVGVTTQVLNNVLHKSKLVSVGAAHGSVAPAGGYGQTSGHSPISDFYGLGSDNFLEFKVVTPDGTLRVANKVSNPDLFWALRGGGGSTFGVVVEATMKAHPTMPVTVVLWTLNNTGAPDNQGIWDAYAELHKYFPDFVEKKHTSGYYYHYGSRITGIFLHKGEGAGKKNADKVWEPVMAKMESFPGVKKTNYTVNEYDSFKGYFDARFGAIDKPAAKSPTSPWEKPTRMVEAFVLDKRHEPDQMVMSPAPKPITNLDSRLLGQEHFLSKNLTAALKAALPVGLGGQLALIQGHLVGGGKVHRPDDPDTAVLPAWRKAYTHVIGYKVPGKPGVDSLRLLAPESGAYANEAFALEQNWKQTFWGSNYEKLSQLKTKYDPNMLLWVSPGINADLYEAKGGRQCKRTTPYTGKEAPRGDNPNGGRALSGSIN